MNGTTSNKRSLKTTSSVTRSIQLPLLYFEHRGSPLTVTTTNCETTTTTTTNDESNKFLQLPAEIVQQCLISYATWGDLAKLCTVQKEWKMIVSDAAQQTLESKWSLSQALLYGTDGLVVRPRTALQLLHELASESSSSSSLAHNVIIQSTRLIAQLYLDGCSASSLLQNDDDDKVTNKEDIPVDTDLGLLWLERCYNIGDAEAAHDLALIYEYGQYNVPIDVVVAFEWFTKAATVGHVEAMAELGLCYELGCGVEQSDTLALDWYMKAAEHGHCTAKYSIGEAFEEARGVPQSDEEACLWYYKAAIDGCEDSRLALRRLQDIARIVIPGARALLNNDGDDDENDV